MLKIKYVKHIPKQKNASGAYYLKSNTIYIKKGLAFYKQFIIFLHEFGHWFINKLITSSNSDYYDYCWDVLWVTFNKHIVKKEFQYLNYLTMYWDIEIKKEKKC